MISTTRMSDCSSANTRPRISSSTSVPIMVVPARYATPAPNPTPSTKTMASATCGITAVSTRQTPGEHDRQPEQPPPGQLTGDPRAERHPEPRPDEHRPEQHAVRRVAAAEAADEDLARADHGAAGDERADQADDQPTDEPGVPDERRALADQEHAGWRLSSAAVAGGGR